MGVFKLRRRDKVTGEVIYSRRWYVEFADGYGIRRRLMGFETKRETDALAGLVNQLVSCRICGIQPDSSLQHWIDNLPPYLQLRFADWYLIEREQAERNRPIDAHLADFEANIRSKGRSSMHIQTLLLRLRRVLDVCKISSVGMLDAQRIETDVSGLKMSDQSKKHHIQAIKQFSTWLYHAGRTNTDLLLRLTLPRVVEIVRPRRALSRREVGLLLEAARTSEIECEGLNGRERHLLYRIALETGLRANEIRTLRVEDFDFAALTVRIRPQNEKARRGAILPLKPDLAGLIEEYTAPKGPRDTVIYVSQYAARMLRTDLEAAGIPFKTGAGQADFHALRHTFGTLLAQSGTPPQVAQKLMRHSDPRLTQNLYTHLQVDDLRSGMRLPEF